MKHKYLNDRKLCICCKTNIRKSPYNNCKYCKNCSKYITDYVKPKKSKLYNKIKKLKESN